MGPGSIFARCVTRRVQCAWGLKFSFFIVSWQKYCRHFGCWPSFQIFCPTWDKTDASTTGYQILEIGFLGNYAFIPMANIRMGNTIPIRILMKRSALRPKGIRLWFRSIIAWRLSPVVISQCCHISSPPSLNTSCHRPTLLLCWDSKFH